MGVAQSYRWKIEEAGRALEHRGTNACCDSGGGQTHLELRGVQEVAVAQHSSPSKPFGRTLESSQPH